MTFRPPTARRSDPEWMTHHQFNVQRPVANRLARQYAAGASDEARKRGAAIRAGGGGARYGGGYRADCPGTLRFTDKGRPVWEAQCDVCGWTIGVRAEGLDRAGMARRRLQRSRVPAVHTEDLESHPGNEDAIDVCRWFVERFDSEDAPQGPLLHGPVGTGKTHLIARTVAQLVRVHLVEVVYYTMPDLLAELRSRMHGRDEDADDLIAQLGEVQVLVLDDLGANQASPWALEVLERIVDERERHARTLLGATNVPPAEWPDELGQRTTSRLLGMCNVTAIEGEDRRGQRNQPAGGNVVPLHAPPAPEKPPDDGIPF